MFGCASAPAPEGPTPGATSVPQVNTETGFTGLVVGSGDSVAALPGSPEAVYQYRFRQIDPGSDRFTFQDRDLSFYFRPTPAALHFQVENRQDRPVWIEWDRCTFIDPFGNTGKVAHSTTSWGDRFSNQTPTQVLGLQRFGDYMLPLNYLADPSGQDIQIHRPLFPEDATAPQFTDRTFGVDMVFRIENRLRTYSFRYRVASVFPR